MGLLPVNNLNVIPKAKCFPGKQFPQEQAYTTLAALESIRQGFRRKHAEELLSLNKT